MPGQPKNQQHATRVVVERARNEHYLLLSLVAFAASVIVTRLYLQLTGYPQIGGGNIHIAHLLWGGLLLYTAALLPLIFGSSRALSWSAVLSGVGIGLFIDEVGKFITSNNDYFYPPAFTNLGGMALEATNGTVMLVAMRAANLLGLGACLWYSFLFLPMSWRWRFAASTHSAFVRRVQTVLYWRSARSHLTTASVPPCSLCRAVRSLGATQLTGPALKWFSSKQACSRAANPACAKPTWRVSTLQRKRTKWHATTPLGTWQTAEADTGTSASCPLPTSSSTTSAGACGRRLRRPIKRRSTSATSLPTCPSSTATPTTRRLRSPSSSAQVWSVALHERRARCSSATHTAVCSPAIRSTASSRRWRSQRLSRASPQSGLLAAAALERRAVTAPPRQQRGRRHDSGAL